MTTATNAVTLAIGTNPGGRGALTCTGTGTNGLTFTANAGVASATGCKITGKAGTTYTLTAASYGFTTVTSNAFSITFGAASQLVFTASPAAGPTGRVDRSRASPSRTPRATWSPTRPPRSPSPSGPTPAEAR